MFFRRLRVFARNEGSEGGAMKGMKGGKEMV